MNSFFSVHGANQLSAVGHVFGDNANFNTKNGNRFVVVPVPGVDKAVINAIQYAKLLTGNIVAVHILLDPSERDKIESQWNMQGMDVPLFILESPNTSIIEPLREYVDNLRLRNKAGVVTVVLPVIATSKWWHRFLFNCTARLIERAFEGKAGVATIRVPFSLTDTA
ncbi:MAG: hypothetical protein ACLQF0_01195 [Dissulfurispiraceae bacterium]